MAGLEGISATRRDGGTDEQKLLGGEESPTRTGRNAKPKNPSGVGEPGNIATSGKDQGNSKIDGNGELEGQPADGTKVGLELPQEDLHARSYEHYYKATVGEHNGSSAGGYLKNLGTRLISSLLRPIYSDPTPVIDCFDTFIGCVKVTDGKVTVIQGSEQLATVSALSCLHKLSFLVATDTILSVESVRQRYTQTFPSDANFDGLPFAHTLGAIHTVFYQSNKSRGNFPTSMVQTTLFTWQAQLATRKHWWEDGGPSSDERDLVADVFTSCGTAGRPWRVQWDDYKPPSDEYVIVSHALAKLAQFEYRRRGQRKVPRWLLRFAFHSLSRHPLPPTSVIIDCLSIIALDLGCGFSNTTTLHESVQLYEVSHLITQKLGTTVETVRPGDVPTCKAVSALLPFVARPELHGRYVALDALLHVFRTSEGMIWNPIVRTLFNEISPLAIVLLSPHVDWNSTSLPDREVLVTQWVAAASEVPYTDEVGQNVVDVLLQVAPWPFLRSHLPIGIWSWLERLPPLPPKCYGRTMGGEDCVLCHVRSLGDINILKSYLLLIWSEWDRPWPGGYSESPGLMRRDFGGVEMKGHRNGLIRHLDHVLAQLDLGLGYLRQQKPRLFSDHVEVAKEEYRRIREILLEVDREAEAQTQPYSTFTYASPLPCQPYPHQGNLESDFMQSCMIGAYRSLAVQFMRFQPILGDSTGFPQNARFGRRREPPTLRDGRATERTTVSGIAERTVSTVDEIQGLSSTKVNM